MKIAIIGNMNNNGFALLRYLRDLGEDAYLLPYQSDGVGKLSHFRPENDTWHIESQSRYIRQLAIPNSTACIVGGIRPPRLPIQGAVVARQVADFDYLIGSGIAPALMHRAGRRLDIFCPYAIGVEVLDNPEFLAALRANPLRRAMHSLARKVQAAGIKETKHCVTSELGPTRRAFERLGVEIVPLSMPMVYNCEAGSTDGRSQLLRSIVGSVEQHDLLIGNFSRQCWLRPPGMSQVVWNGYSKNSDWLIRGFAQFLHRRPNADPLLILSEYGPDVRASKALCDDLGLSHRVRWVPILPRRVLMEVLRACDIGVGEFIQSAGVMWGGAGWEVLASGLPLLQTVNFTDGEYESAFGHKAPPILDVKSPEDVAQHLAALHESPSKRAEIGKLSSSWFDEYGGVGLARRWVSLIRTTAS